MKRLIWAAFAAFILSGCSIPKFGSELKTEIDAEALPYVEKFADIYGVTMPPLILTIGELDTGVALCNRYETGQKEVVINRASWDAACPETRQAIVFHELGHCVLDRDHEPLSVISYMRQAVYDCSFYIDNEAALVAELFSF